MNKAMSSSTPSEPEPYVEQSVSSGGAQPSAKAIYQQRKNYAKTVAAMGEMSEYKVEHLVTFAMERKEAILRVDDSIRKLQLLDARGKVWTQEILLQVDDKSVKLADCETKEELEHFPLTSLQHIQSVIDACTYNSICAIVVKDANQKTPDIHLFQCSTVPADVICADISSAFQDIKSKKGRKNRPETLRRHRETIEATTRPPSTPPINVRDKVAEWTNAIEAQNEAPPLTARTSMNAQAENSPEIMAFKIHRDVQMLNHSLDDIEIFVSLIQKSAEATRELTVRQSKKKSSKKGRGKAPGSGIMELRARLPPKEQFSETFQKFRFCFNLLAKLKNHIKDPNAVELTHFLFHPLGLIINTCCGPDLARTVKTPLLQKDTIAFLRSCVTAQELQLWQNLGMFWTQSKGEFPKEMFFAPYVPTFTSGWVPPPIPSMESEPQVLAAAIRDQADHVQRAKEAWKAGGANIEDALKPLSPVSSPPDRAPRNQSAIVRRASNAFKQHVENHVARNQAAQSAPTPPRKLCRAMYDFSARNENELSVRRDALLDVLDDSKSWWKVQNEDGETGYVPENLMLLISSAGKSETPSPPPFVPPPPPPPTQVPAPPPLQAASVPKPSLSTPRIQPVSFNSASLNSVVLKKTTPPPKRAPSINSDHLQAELLQRVSAQKQRNFILPKKSSSSSVVINKHSSSREVVAWLRSLSFSDITVASLGVLNGAQIFTLNKEELKQICDDEGARVYSQLMVQRSMDGFATANERSELGRIMKMRRQVIPDEEY